MEVDSWLTGKRGISLPFTDEIELLYTTLNSRDYLYENAFKEAKRRNWKYLELRSGTGYSESVTPSLRYYTHKLGLNQEIQTLLNQCDSPTRRAIRKSERSKLKVHRSQSLESTAAYYDLHCLTRKRQGVPPQPWRFFKNIHKNVISRGKGSIFLASKESRPIAGALFLHHDKCAMYKFGASNFEYQSMRPNNLVIWKAIQWLVQNRYDRIDFGRTSLGNAGLRRFKQGWGTREEVLSYYRHDISSGNVEQLHDQSSGWYNPIFRTIPKFLSLAIGNLMYKHIA